MNKVLLAVVASVVALASNPGNAGGKRELGNAAIARLLKRDAARDATTAAVPAAESRMVWRYTSNAKAEGEMSSGMAVGSHFTPKVTPGRPPRPSTVQRQYGLPEPPQVRMTVRIDEGRLVLKNKALGGEPSRGELVNAEPLPPGAVQKVTRLPRE